MPDRGHSTYPLTVNPARPRMPHTHAHNAHTPQTRRNDPTPSRRRPRVPTPAPSPGGATPFVYVQFYPSLVPAIYTSTSSISGRHDDPIKWALLKFWHRSRHALSVVTTRLYLFLSFFLSFFFQGNRIFLWWLHSTGPCIPLPFMLSSLYNKIMEQFGTRGDVQCDFFYFNHFLILILKITRLLFYLHI